MWLEGEEAEGEKSKDISLLGKKTLVKRFCVSTDTLHELFFHLHIMSKIASLSFSLGLQHTTDLL